jgi:hypothetical protein
MRVIYATSELDEWVELAEHMQARKKWEPVYWVTTPKNEKKIQKHFPSTHCQNFIDAIRGRYMPLEGLTQVTPLDSVTIVKYNSYEKVALKMMDRMDATAYSFNYSERLQLYYDFLAYWINAIKVLNADYVLFSESPHALFQYILYAVCVENDIKVLRFVPTHIDGLTFLAYSIDKSPKYLQGKVLSRALKTSLMQKYIDRIRGEYSIALPYYMKDIHDKRTLGVTIKKSIGKLKRFFTSKTILAYKKSASVALSEVNIAKKELLYYKVRGLWFKQKLQKSYTHLAIKPNLNKDYIYVALHYQPEKTTSPEGGIFVDQWLMVQMLAFFVPEGWLIYVKEHSAQFAERLYGEQGRTHDFYERCDRLKNVKLVATETSSFDLIDNAKAVATVTGTVGLESVIRSVPVLCFGHAWYAQCEGVFEIRNNNELHAVLQKIKKGYQIDKKAVEYFLYAIEEISLQCYLNPGNKAGVSFDKEENLKNLIACLVAYAEKE